MKHVYLRKQDLPEFIDHIKKDRTVVAPVRKENQFVFAPVDDASRICLDYIPSILPPKKYFFHQKEELGSFDLDDVSLSETSVEVEPLIVFGAHTCDIAGIECLDVVFNESPPDPYYFKRKQSILIIGYECMRSCDGYATCVTMDTHVPKGGYDIMITDAGGKYILHINSEGGNNLIKKCRLIKEGDEKRIRSELAGVREAKKKNFTVPLEAAYNELYDIFEKSYYSRVWDDVGRRCVSCGNCTAVCPTCYCFDLYDELKLDLRGGNRKRVWDSCQLEEFAKVAGGENFRKTRSSRQKHRYYRKFDYPVEKYNKFFCTGCGRCTRTCMAKISLIETVNDLTKECKSGK